ncbi:hypothetical protein [Mesorhizobium sp. YR577]|uniref:hypothetical protein n=1 Tax=Mesorhizobium sp. YR577 TaxID=1884373 RepID=UPI000B80BDBF|nr:hypothetical protein [Mesorhizobium sp. YR577]
MLLKGLRDMVGHPFEAEAGIFVRAIGTLLDRAFGLNLPAQERFCHAFEAKPPFFKLFDVFDNHRKCYPHPTILVSR